MTTLPRDRRELRARSGSDGRAMATRRSAPCVSRRATFVTSPLGVVSGWGGAGGAAGAAGGRAQDGGGGRRGRGGGLFLRRANPRRVADTPADPGRSRRGEPADEAQDPAEPARGPAALHRAVKRSMGGEGVPATGWLGGRRCGEAPAPRDEEDRRRAIERIRRRRGSPRDGRGGAGFHLGEGRRSRFVERDPVGLAGGAGRAEEVREEPARRGALCRSRSGPPDSSEAVCATLAGHNRWALRARRREAVGGGEGRKEGTGGGGGRRGSRAVQVSTATRARRSWSFEPPVRDRRSRRPDPTSTSDRAARPRLHLRMVRRSSSRALAEASLTRAAAREGLARPPTVPRDVGRDATPGGARGVGRGEVWRGARGPGRSRLGPGGRGEVRRSALDAGFGVGARTADRLRRLVCGATMGGGRARVFSS